MTDIYTYPDVEAEMVDFLDDMLAAVGEDVTVSVGVPDAWKPTSTPHVQVVCDGTPRMDHPVAVYPSLRLVVRAGTTSEAKRLAMLAQAVAVSHDGTWPVAWVRPLTGILPVRDPETNAEIAMVTCQVAIRSHPVAVSS